MHRRPPASARAVLRLAAACLAIAGLRAETVAFFGDSLTAGYGLREDEAYPALVGAQLQKTHPQWQVINAGVSGDTTAGGLRRIDWLLKRKPDLVVVALGANDGLRGLDPQATAANLSAIVRRIRAAGSRAIVAGIDLPANYGDDYRARFRAVFPAVAEAEGVPLLPFLLEGVAMVERLNQADRVHPNAAGQRVIAEHVLAFLTPHLEPAAPAASP